MIRGSSSEAMPRQSSSLKKFVQNLPVKRPGPGACDCEGGGACMPRLKTTGLGSNINCAQAPHQLVVVHKKTVHDAKLDLAMH